MGSFKDQLAEDIDTVFFNLDEFGSVHNVNGADLLVVLYDEEDQAHEGGARHNIGGLSSDSPTVAIRRDDLGERLPSYGENFKLDGKLYKVKSVSDQTGVVHIQLTSYRSGGAR